MNCWTGKNKRITPDMLLGRKGKPLTKEQVEERRRELKQLFPHLRK